MTSVNSGEIQEINLQPTSEKAFKFCLVRRETELGDEKKEYQADVYSLDVGQAEQERLVKILRTLAGLQVTLIGGEDHDQNDLEAPEMTNEDADLEILSPLVAGKIYSDREKVTADNWSAWLESRHQFKREGPIFLSFSRTSAGPTETELREELERLVRENVIRSDQFIFVQYLKKKMIQS